MILFSCDVKSDPESHHYPVDSLIRAQVSFLTSSKAVLTKKAEIDGSEETSSFTPADTTAWLHELDIFSELSSINKPVNMSSYRVEKGIKDPNSNLSIQTFTTSEKLPIVYLRVFYLNIPARIRRIEALYHEENSLLKGSRLMVMEFQEIHNKIVLVSYSIEGGQKMFMGDTVKFSVRGTVNIP